MKIATWRKIIVGGAKAGMKQKGNFAKASTPIVPLSMDSLVSKIAVMAVKAISNEPKVFQIRVTVLAFFCF